MQDLEQLLSKTPYVGYSYSYPHKMAYRPFAEPIPLRDVWSGERRDSLFLYLHIPFCEMRCGFCNLFTTANPTETIESQYLAALKRQAQRVREAIGDPITIDRMAIGGGTPTYLDLDGLNTVFDIAEDLYGADLQQIPISVETSPRTAEPEKLQLLRERGVDRVSIGVQSFIETEVAAIGRAQKTAQVEAALGQIREAKIPTLNIDLMYGLPHQTVETWLNSLEAALRFQPEELYLYPLYVRPLTGLDKSPREWDDIRLTCYRTGRERLLSLGYTQISMRMFRAPHAPELPKRDGPVYCCQDDGMIGLGCGARSYTSQTHYASEYAVGRSSVKGILADYIAKPDTAFDSADYGTRLNQDEQKRRYVINGLLQSEGVNAPQYKERFGASVYEDLPQLSQLETLGLATKDTLALTLTERGLERSDMIGPWLYSDAARHLISGYQLR